MKNSITLESQLNLNEAAHICEMCSFKEQEHSVYLQYDLKAYVKLR